MTNTADVAGNPPEDQTEGDKHEPELIQFVESRRSRSSTSCHRNGTSDSFGLLAVLCVVAVVLPSVVAILSVGSSHRPSSPTEHRSATPSAKRPTSTDDVSKTDAVLAELKAIEREAIRRVSQGHTDAPDLSARVDRLEQYAQDRVNGMNRRAHERGYSLATRKKAAVTTLMQQGYSRADAELTVDDMVRMNLLPDPPRR